MLIDYKKPTGVRVKEDKVGACRAQNNVLIGMSKSICRGRRREKKARAWPKMNDAGKCGKKK